MTFECKAGDVLLFEHPNTIPERLIEYGERRADGKHQRWFYHTAFVISPYKKIEALMQTELTPIGDLSNAIVCRPPYQDSIQLSDAIMWAMGYVGRAYGWGGIFDQTIRDLTYNHIHLPRWVVTVLNRIWPYCSVEANFIMQKAGFKLIPPYPPPDPEAVWNALKPYVVYDWRENV